MSSVTNIHDTGEQIDLGRENWMSCEAQAMLKDAVEDPSIGAEKTLAILLHHGLGLSLTLVASLLGKSKATITKQIITGTRKLAGQKVWHPLDDSEATTLEGWLEYSVEHCSDLQPNTKTHYRTVKQRLLNHFAGRMLSSITPADAESFIDSLAADGLAPRSIASMTSTARSIFRSAVRIGLLDENPFRNAKQLNAAQVEGSLAI